MRQIKGTELVKAVVVKVNRYDDTQVYLRYETALPKTNEQSIWSGQFNKIIYTHRKHMRFRQSAQKLGEPVNVIVVSVKAKNTKCLF